ncbi:MAG: lamin tail domain-containing protein, partial [Candidatus Omnitrophica bacterium]|nr:lamin tail domain-containing protein [Candidatus Omnitrophota bacterium]
VVVAKNLDHLLARYPELDAAKSFGDYSGALKDSGEELLLERPVWRSETNGLGVLTSNVSYVTVNEVRYRGGGRWGQWSDGGGSSLELMDAWSDNRLAANWADSDESAKAPWTTIEQTGVLDLGNANYPASNVQVLLLGEGECLVDDVEVISGGLNLVANGTFESGTTSWRFDGNHERTSLETNEGFNSAQSLHLRASGDGDTYANRVSGSLVSTIPAGRTATLRARVRWFRGHPEVLLRLRGNWLEACGSLTVPENLGTPGARNSRAVDNAGPAISGVVHSPVLPAVGQPVVVSARVQDPDGIASVQLKYRVDPSLTYAAVTMVDDGTGGDELAGDGVYSGTIPGRPANTLVAFYVEARDGFEPPAATRFPGDAPGRECLARFGEVQPFGSFGTYRVWLTQAASNRWSSRGHAGKEPVDCTFVVDPGRVIYNAGAYFSGSPFKTQRYDTPTGNPCDYHLVFPSDDRLNGANATEVAYLGNVGAHDDFTAQREQIAYWIGRQLGLAYNERRYVHLFVNGVHRGMIMEDTQVPDRDVVKEVFPDDPKGELFKAAIWYESDNIMTDNYGTSATWGTMANFTTTGGVKKTARFRWNFQPRAVIGSANDFTNWFRLVDALNGPPAGYTQAVEFLADAEQWMRAFACEHLLGQWDSLGYRSGANMYLYQGLQGRWTMLIWDMDIAFVADGPGNDLFQSDDAVLRRMNSHPPFRRAYWRALQDAVNGPLASDKINRLLDARYAALRANGIAVTPPDNIKSYINQQRTYVLGQLASVVTPFTVSGSVTFNTDRNQVTLTGTAPIDAATIAVNGVTWPVTWTTVNNWSLQVPLAPGTNTIVIAGVNERGQPVAGSSATFNINYIGAGEQPEDDLVISEIMPHPLVPGASFIEIYNRSGTNAFDLSSWRIEGIDCDIPAGTIIAPGQYLVFAKDSGLFGAEYGSAIPVAGEFNGQLEPSGETLKLIKPGGGTGPDEIIDQVKYGNEPPWPAASADTPRSLQLIDPAQDNARAGNWTMAGASPVPTNTPLTLLDYSDAWKFMQVSNLDAVNWTAPAFDDSGWPSGPGLLACEDCNCLPEPIRTQLTVSNGRITFYFRAHFNYTGSLAGVSLKLSTLVDDGAVYYLNGQEIYRLGINPGTVNYSTLASPGVTDASTYSGPFLVPATALVTGDNVVAVEVHQNGPSSSDIVFGLKLETDFSSSSSNRMLATPGAANSVRSSLPPFPPIWLNEVEPENLLGLEDTLGHCVPWLELFNSGTSSVSLSGLYLANNYTNLAQWAFPTGAVINLDEFKVIFADGVVQESSSNEWHTDFTVSPASGSVVLSRLYNGQLQVLDYLNYNGIGADRSYGSAPDGQPFENHQFYYPTPGASNNVGMPLSTVLINEWLAANKSAGGNADPADGNFDDWFELYNPGATTVDLTGCYLSDNLTNQFQFRIPDGYSIPAGGFLLVWADNETSQNQAGRPDLHVNFKLDQAGDEIGLCAADGAQIDAVKFGPQTDNVSQGRYRDGSTYLFFMPVPTPGAPNRIAPPPSPRLIGSFIQPDGQLSFSFQVTPGLKYRVEYKDDLNATTWTPLGSDQIAGTNTVTISSPPSTSQRFFRVLMLP